MPGLYEEKNTTSASNQGDDDVAVVGDPEHGRAIDDDVAHGTAADGRQQREHRKTKMSMPLREAASAPLTAKAAVPSISSR